MMARLDFFEPDGAPRFLAEEGLEIAHVETEFPNVFIVIEVDKEKKYFESQFDKKNGRKLSSQEWEKILKAQPVESHEFPDLNHGLRITYEWEERPRCTFLRTEVFSLESNEAIDWGSWSHPLVFLPGRGWSFGAFDPRSEVENCLEENASDEEWEREREEFFQEEYPGYTFNKKFVWWVWEFAADGRIWDVNPYEQFHLEQKQLLDKVDPQHTSEIFDSLAMYWELELSKTHELLTISREDQRWNDLTDFLKKQERWKVFRESEYQSYTDQQRERFWHLRFIFRDEAFSVSPYTMIDKDFRELLRDLEGDNDRKMLQHLCEHFSMDTELAFQLYELDDDDPKYEELLTPFWDLDD